MSDFKKSIQEAISNDWYIRIELNCVEASAVDFDILKPFPHKSEIFSADSYAPMSSAEAIDYVVSAFNARQKQKDKK